MPKKLPKAAEPYKFKPGVSGNPAGRPKADPIANALKKLTLKSYQRVIRTVVKGNVAQLEAIAKDPKSSALEVAVASCFARAIRKGEYGVVEKMIERLIGKVPDELHVKSKNFNLNQKVDVDNDVLKEAFRQVELEV